MNTKHDILILPQNRWIKAAAGQSIMSALAEEGIFLRADCGGHGRCAKCRVEITGIESKNRWESSDEHTRDHIKKKIRNALACRETINQNLVVHIPEAAALTAEVTPKPRLSDALVSRIRRLCKPGGAVSEYGLAVDLGTTTIAVYLCDLARGAAEKTVSLKNPQVLFGNDVMSRITAVNENPLVLKRLQQMVVRAVEWGIKNLCRSVEDLNPANIKKMTVVGNPAMLHLFLARDPSGIGEAPYLPKFHDIQKVTAGQIGFGFNLDAGIWTLPLVSGFLGADIVAAALAADLKNAPFGTMLADVGTNGELMAKGFDSMVATSCATGPALEGAVIQHGMQAVSGAISRVYIDIASGKCTCSVKGKQKPLGICGSGIISATAELLRARIIFPDGRFDPKKGFGRLRFDQQDIPEFVLVDEKDSGTGKAITLTQADIRNVQLAKGAFRTGIDFLCKHMGLDAPCRLLVAGAFGNYIRKRDALAIGMFPPMDRKNIRIVGNAAGEGAILALFDPQSLKDARELAQSTQVIDLASQENFQDHFVDSLSFPEI
ncbi:MAG: ASKHA domain-containing protein [Desulfobacterales bacterium]